MTSALDASAKAALRLQMRNLRRAFVREHPEADWQAGDLTDAMLDHLFGIDAPPGIAAIYHASGSECDPRPVGEVLTNRGWRLAFPASEVVDAPVVFRAWKSGDELAPDVVGISAPVASAKAVAPDLIITPLIAFDRQGGWLGQGGGYYDRTLAALRERGHAPAVVGLAFSIQEVPSIPLEPHDQRLDAILTEKEYIPVRKGS